MHRLEIILLDASAHFRGGRCRVAQVYGRRAARALSDFLAEISQPTVVSPANGHGGLAVHLGDAGGPEAGRGIEDHVVHAVGVHHLAVGAGGKVLVGPLAVGEVQFVQVTVLEVPGGGSGVPISQRPPAHYLHLKLKGEAVVVGGCSVGAVAGRCSHPADVPVDEVLVLLFQIIRPNPFRFQNVRVSINKP